jgi:hypothetical protein
MTRKNSATLAAPKAKRAPKAKKITKLEQAILRNFGASPVMYGNDPPKPDLRKIRVDEIRFDHTYQRKFKPGHARKIAAKFDIRKLGIPVVAEREGVPFGVDCQHRIHAISLLNAVRPGFLTSVWCEVTPESGRREESDLFTGRNDSSKVSPTDIFKAKHTAGDPTCVKVANILNGRGLSVKGMKGRGTLPVTCIVPVCWAHERGVLEDAIDAVKSTWGLIEQAFHVTVFHPVAAILVRNRGRVNHATLVQTLSKFTPAGLRTRCGTTDGRGRTVNIANFIVNAYNKVAKKADRIEAVGSSDIH